MGSTERGHGEIGDTLGREGVIYVCPRAPYPYLPVMLEMQKAGYSVWWPDEIESDDEMFHSRIIEQYVDWIFHCVDDVRAKYRVKGDRVFILGHSEGGAFAHACAILHPERVSSYLSYAGYMMSRFDNEESFEGLAAHGVEPFLAHCEGDQLVEVEDSIRTSEYMKKTGVDHDLKVFEKGMHSFTRAAYYYAKAWLDTRIRPDTPVADTIPMLETGWLGVQLGDVGEGGVRIVQLVADSPAEKAGLKEGHVLLKMDKSEITDGQHLIQLLRQTKIGQEATFLVREGEEEKVIPVTLGARP
jgi:predicted esterase